MTAAVDAWGNERDDYDFSNPGFSEQAGHFTQLVWKNTSTVGCARMYCGSANMGWYLVCEYSPRGNVIGSFDQQVQKQASGPPQHVSLGTPGQTAEGDGGVKADGSGSGSGSGSDDGGGCPQGAACDAGNMLRVPWVFQSGFMGAMALLGYLSFWAWIQGDASLVTW